jgi:hypothetical protein
VTEVEEEATHGLRVRSSRRPVERPRRPAAGGTTRRRRAPRWSLRADDRSRGTPPGGRRRGRVLTLLVLAGLASGPTGCWPAGSSNRRHRAVGAGQHAAGAPSRSYRRRPAPAFRNVERPDDDTVGTVIDRSRQGRRRRAQHRGDCGDQRRPRPRRSRRTWSAATSTTSWTS